MFELNQKQFLEIFIAGVLGKSVFDVILPDEYKYLSWVVLVVLFLLGLALMDFKAFKRKLTDFSNRNCRGFWAAMSILLLNYTVEPLLDNYFDPLWLAFAFFVLDVVGGTAILLYVFDSKKQK